MSWMEKLYDLAAASTVTQGTLAIVALGGALYIQATTGKTPEWLTLAVGAIIGFFFGNKTGLQQNVSSSVRKLSERMDVLQDKVK